LIGKYVNEVLNETDRSVYNLGLHYYLLNDYKCYIIRIFYI